MTTVREALAELVAQRDAWGAVDDDAWSAARAALAQEPADDDIGSPPPGPLRDALVAAVAKQVDDMMMAPCSDGDACPDARKYGAVHPTPSADLVRRLRDRAGDDLRYNNLRPYSLMNEAATAIVERDQRIAALEGELRKRDRPEPWTQADCEGGR